MSFAHEFCTIHFKPLASGVRGKMAIVPSGKPGPWPDDPEVYHYSLDGATDTEPSFFYHESITCPQGADIILFVESGAEDFDVKRAKQWLRENGDVVRLYTYVFTSLPEPVAQ